MLKIAVATSDGTNIDEHFGQAEVFRIFEVEESGVFRLVEERRITPHCPGDHDVAHSSDATVAQLAGVAAVFANRIGPGAVKSLAEQGIRAYAISGPVDRALSSYGKRYKLIEAGVIGGGLTPASSGGKGCGCSGRCR